MDPKRPSRPGIGAIQPPKAPLKPGLAGPAGQRPGVPGAAGATAGAAAVRRPAAGIGEDLDRLSVEIQQLQIEFERFFNGALPIPPEELRTRIQAQIRNFRNLNLTSADSFRLGAVEARFNSYNEMFNRRVRDREEGRHPGAVRATAPERRRYDAREGITFGVSPDPEAVEALYQGLSSGVGDGPKFDLDSFEKYLARQVAALREKTGCDQVQFRLAEEDGKVKLKARPVPRAGS